VQKGKKWQSLNLEPILLILGHPGKESQNKRRLSLCERTFLHGQNTAIPATHSGGRKQTGTGSGQGCRCLSLFAKAPQAAEPPARAAALAEANGDWLRPGCRCLSPVAKAPQAAAPPRTRSTNSAWTDARDREKLASSSLTFMV
jgi:hypothetical protein